MRGFCAGVNSASAEIQVCFPVFMLSDRDCMMKVGELSASQGQGARIKRKVEMFDFLHREGNQSEAKHISQAKQLHIPLLLQLDQLY